jgi:ring-1,2-phenylacetyl-CoA epoxidase subunit PaaA
MTTTRSAVTSDDDPRLAVKFQRWDELDDDYRKLARKMASFQVLAELVGVMQFVEWLPMVPDFCRKQMLTAKIQDEVGHGHVMARVAEDLGADRDAILWDWLEGRTKLLNIFHFDFKSWEELGMAALIVNSAAIVQFQSFDKGTYLPYGRALKKIEKEEAFHYHHALDLTHELLTHGTTVQRDRVHEAFATWLGRTLVYFGPPDSHLVANNPLYQAGLKVDSNDALRERYLDRMVPVWRGLGLPVDDFLSYDESAGRWATPGVPIDWAAEKKMLEGGGPAYERWKDMIRTSLEKNARYAALARGKAA